MNKRLSGNGVFSVASGKEMHGRLTLDGPESMLELWSTSGILNERLNETRFITGLLDDQRKVILIDCIDRGRRTIFGEEIWHHFSFFPRYAVVGPFDEQKGISEVFFVTDDAKVLFYDGSFDVLTLDSADLVTLLRGAGVSVESTAHPIVHYWTGKEQILSTETPVGRVSVANCPTQSLSADSPPSLTNQIRVSVEFLNPLETTDLYREISRILRFFAVIVGRPQTIQQLEAFQQDDDGPISYPLYINDMPGRTEEGEFPKLYSMDTLINAAREPDMFGRVMARWLERDETWDLARTRFFTGWNKQRLYDSDRMVGAANMFEALPQESMPPKTPLSPDFAMVIEQSKELFRGLPGSRERDSMLMNLGQAGSPPLKDKIHYRSALITEAIGKALPEMEYVTDAAVDLRNYFVHGNMSDQRRSLTKSGIFLTNTLEFIFCASDLIESGWELASWYHRKPTIRHPFGWYLDSYPQNLANLRLERRH